MSAVISFLAALISFLFAGAVLRQYRQRQQPFRLMWSVALLCYGLATGVQFLAELRGWSTASFRAWYLFGGLLTAAYLGQGTAFLLLRRRLALTLFWLLVAASLWGALRTASVPLTFGQIRPADGKISPTATHLPADLRALAALLNIYGTLLLVGGALWSALVYVDRMLDRRRRAAYRLVSNLLIAGGSLVLAGAGSLETFGHGEFLYAGEIVGITIIFLGFLRSHEAMRWPFSRTARGVMGRATEPKAPTQPMASDSGPPFRSLARLKDRANTPRR